MKGLLKNVFGLLVTAVLANARSYTYSQSYGTTTFGDVRIKTYRNGIIECDSMICPKEASHCRVTKRNDPTDSEVIVRYRACFDDEDDVIDEEEVTEPNPSNGKVN